MNVERNFIEKCNNEGIAHDAGSGKSYRRELVQSVKMIGDGSLISEDGLQYLSQPEINDVKLEYYLTESDFSIEPDLIPSKVYGIEIIKRSGSSVDVHKVRNIGFCRECTRNILNTLARNTVTPVSVPFVLDDILGS